MFSESHCICQSSSHLRASRCFGSSTTWSPAPLAFHLARFHTNGFSRFPHTSRSYLVIFHNAQQAKIYRRNILAIPRSGLRFEFSPVSRAWLDIINARNSFSRFHQPHLEQMITAQCRNKPVFRGQHSRMGPKLGLSTQSLDEKSQQLDQDASFLEPMCRRCGPSTTITLLSS